MLVFLLGALAGDLNLECSMKKFLVAGAIGTWLLGSACGRLGTGDDMLGDGDGDASVGSNKGDGDAGDGDLGDGDVGDGDFGDGDFGGMLGDGDLGDGDRGDGDSAGGFGGMTIGDGDGDIVPDLSIPICTITAPQENTTTAFHGERVVATSQEPAAATFTGITFRAVATDLEDGMLKGESIAWFLEGSGASGGDEYLGSGNELTVEALPPGEHEIACHAYDSDENVGFDYVNITSVSPVIYIDHPGEFDGPRPSGDAVEFWAVGYDFEDGTLDSETFLWESNLDGVLGEGNGTYSLSPGQHKVQVKGVDEDQTIAYATVSVWIAEVQVEPEPPETD